MNNDPLSQAVSRLREYADEHNMRQTINSRTKVEPLDDVWRVALWSIDHCFKNCVTANCEYATEAAGRIIDYQQLVTTEWLMSEGWAAGDPWPFMFLTKVKQTLYWRGAGLWIGETPIASATTRGKLLRIVEALL